MAIVTIKYLGNFSLITRKREEEISIKKNENIYSLTNKLRQKYGRKFEKSFDNPMTVVWINNTTCDKDTVLHQGDELTLHHRDKLIIGTLAGGG